MVSWRGLGDVFPPDGRGCGVGWGWRFRARRVATDVQLANARVLCAEVLVVSVSQTGDHKLGDNN